MPKEFKGITDSNVGYQTKDARKYKLSFDSAKNMRRRPHTEFHENLEKKRIRLNAVEVLRSVPQKH